MSRVYIAGPMTGKKAYNFALFNALAENWRKHNGAEVSTPFDSCDTVWQKHYGRDFDPHKDTCEYGSPLLAEMFAENIRLLARAETIVFLPGWQGSKGACAEFYLGHLLKKVLLDAATMREMEEVPVLGFLQPSAE